MERIEYIENNNTIFKKIQNQISLVLIALVAVALIVNLGLLTFLGTKGEELAEIRNLQESQKLENDLIRAELEEIKVNSKLESLAREELNMKDTDVKVIDVITSDTISAQQ